ncbi:unnamed protein product [Clavelina lepadiformis]|uniref:Uncharacterized protein n=1 Tax=Clavelina lepadiformis TaxID=159417 RepID=A0ABP0FFJ5_CLALP
MPGTVLTNITKNYEELQKMPSPETYCKSWLATIGKARWTHGYWKHAIDATGNKFWMTCKEKPQKEKMSFYDWSSDGSVLSLDGIRKKARDHKKKKDA